MGPSGHDGGNRAPRKWRPSEDVTATLLGLLLLALALLGVIPAGLVP